MMRFSYTAEIGNCTICEVLTRIENGYGGAIGLAPRWKKCVSTSTTDPNFMTCPWGQPQNGRIVVDSRQVTDGVDAPPIDTSYDYVNSAYKTIDGHSQFRGFERSTERLHEAGGTSTMVRETTSRYHQNDDQLKGRQIEETISGYDSNDQFVILRRTRLDWTVAQNPTFARLDRITEYLNEQQQLQRDFVYDGYANVTQTREWAEAGAVQPTRVITRTYVPNPTTHVVNKIAEERVFDGDSNCRGVTRYVYDAQTDFRQAPTQGLLREVWAPEDGNTDCDYQYLTRLAYFEYDVYGNQKLAQDVQGRKTLTSYDDIFHAFPVSVSVVPAVEFGGIQRPTLVSTNAYYGINADPDFDDPDSARDGLLGQLQKTADPNLAATFYSYDEFGRPKKVVRPGDIAACSTSTYTYSDILPAGQISVTAPYSVEVRAREQHASQCPDESDQVQRSYQLFDGLGRLVQERTETIDGSQQTVTTSTYDEYGLPLRSYVPEFEGWSTVWVAPPAGRAFATTTHDALGRLVDSIQPNGVKTGHHYLGGKSAIIDGKQHQTIHELDGLGRMTAAKQYTGTYTAPNWAAIPYAEAVYEYDARDNLIQVTSGVSATAVITMSYDLNGNKLAMRDPDMGLWKYQYAEGQLVRQTDARGWSTCLFYDGQGRMLGKTYQQDNELCLYGYGLPWDAPVHYAYDDTANGNQGLGRRTSAWTAEGVSDAWTYDARGRVVRQVRSFDAGQPYTTTWTYDAADRVASIIYPGNLPGTTTPETVSLTYNAVGLPESMAGAEVYVQQATYDAAGRLTDLALQSGTLVNGYDYYAWTGNGPNGGRLQSIEAGIASDPDSLLRMIYAYDAAGNISWLYDSEPMHGGEYFYQYDELNRVTQLEYPGWGTAEFAYDPYGNLLTNYYTDDHWTPWAALAYEDPAHLHAVTTLTPLTQNSCPETYGYDPNGNLVGLDVACASHEQHHDLAWNAAGLLSQYEASCRENGFPTQYYADTYEYDADGRLARRSAEDGLHKYVNAYAEWRDGYQTSYYFFGDQRIAVREQTAAEMSEVSYLFADHLSSIRASYTN